MLHDPMVPEVRHTQISSKGRGVGGTGAEVTRQCSAGAAESAEARQAGFLHQNHSGWGVGTDTLPYGAAEAAEARQAGRELQAEMARSPTIKKDRPEQAHSIQCKWDHPI